MFPSFFFSSLPSFSCEHSECRFTNAVDCSCAESNRFLRRTRALRSTIFSFRRARSRTVLRRPFCVLWNRKVLQTSGDLTLRAVAFQRIASRGRRFLYATRAKRVWIEVLASELHFCRDFSPVFWLFDAKRSNVVIKGKL